MENNNSLKEVLITAGNYINVLRRKILLIIFIPLLTSAIYGYYLYNQEKTYKATLHFMVDDESSGGGLNGAAAILGSFGISGGPGEHNLDKVIALAKTSKIIGNAILDTSYSPLLANQLIEEYKLHERWEESKLINGFKFETASKGLAHNKALKKVSTLIKGNESTEGIAEFKYDEDTGIITIQAITVQPELSINLVESLYNQIAKFYTTEKTKKSKQNFTLLKTRADSVQQELAKAEYNLAAIQDQSKGLILKEDRVKLRRIERSASILTIMYGEILKNKETASFILQTETPFFQKISEPRLPIDPVKKGLLKNTLLTFIGSTLVVIMILIGIQIFQEALERN